MKHILAPYPPLKRALTDTEQAADEKRAEIMDVVRNALWDHGDMGLLAIRVGRSVSCLNSIRSGRTRWPRWDTLLSLMYPLGLELTIRKIGDRR